MKPAYTFITAKPSRKGDMVIDGLEAVAGALERVRMDLKILNGWAKDLPELIRTGKATVDDVSELSEAIHAYKSAIDAIGVQFVDSHFIIENLSSLTKTPNTCES